MDRHAVALVLEEIATLLDASTGNRFRVRAFRSAARAVEKLEGDLPARIADGSLQQAPGIGPATARIIEELVLTGASEYHEALRERAPSGMKALLRVPGLGPRKIEQLHRDLGITDLDSLEAAARAGRIAGVKGFGERTQQQILAGLPFARGTAGRRRYHQALEAAARLAGYLEAVRGVEATAVAGELRRGFEITDALVLVVAATDPERVARSVRGTSGVSWFDERGTTVRGRFGDAFAVEIRVVQPLGFGWALIEATGPDAHVAALRTEASARDVALESIVARARASGDPAAAAEIPIYDALGCAWIAPELREDGDIITVAREGGLPRLIELEDLRGCFHCHTTYSDGTASVAQMAEAAIGLGWEYLGIADHSQNASYAGGLSPAQLVRQRREIDRWNRERGAELWLFAGIEADILPDGQLDYAGQGDDVVLDALDFVIGSVHSQFRMGREKMTRRMCRAVRDPRLTMLGHATGRLLLTRAGYDVDLDAVIDAAAEGGTAIEINADPHRLDMSWQHWPRARALGIRTSINPDAHSTGGLRNVRFGIPIARRARLTQDDVITAWPKEDVVAYLKEKRHAR